MNFQMLSHAFDIDILSSTNTARHRSITTVRPQMLSSQVPAKRQVRLEASLADCARAVWPAVRRCVVLVLTLPRHSAIYHKTARVTTPGAGPLVVPSLQLVIVSFNASTALLLLL